MVGRAPTLDIHETPEHLTQLEALGPESHGLGRVIPSLIELFATGVRIVVTTVLLLSVHPLLLVLPLFGLPALLLSPKTGGMFRLGNELAAEPARRANHLIELTATAGAAKEIRLFRLGDELLRRFHLAHKEIRRIHHRINVRAAGFGLVAQVAFLACYFGAIVFVAGQTAQDGASAGELVLVAVLAGQVIGLVTGSADLLQLGMRNLAAAGRVVYLQDVSARLSAGLDRNARVPGRLTDGIRLENVSYRYPLGQDFTVRELDLVLPAGSTVAVVGDNGAGKTTLVKLLAGLYRPSSGRITVDGVDLENWIPRAGASTFLPRFRIMPDSNSRFVKLSEQVIFPSSTTKWRSGTRSTGPARPICSTRCRLACRPSSVRTGRAASTCRVGSGRSSRSAGP